MSAFGRADRRQTATVAPIGTGGSPVSETLSSPVAPTTGGQRVIRHCTEADFETILAIVNDAAEAYRAVIPPVVGATGELSVSETGAIISYELRYRVGNHCRLSDGGFAR